MASKKSNAAKANKGNAKATKGKPKAAQNAATKGANEAVDVDSLMAELRKANAEGDRQAGKKIRRKLRAAGHWGGLRGVNADRDPA